MSIMPISHQSQHEASSSSIHDKEIQPGTNEVEMDATDSAEQPEFDNTQPRLSDFFSDNESDEYQSAYEYESNGSPSCLSSENESECHSIASTDNASDSSDSPPHPVMGNDMYSDSEHGRPNAGDGERSNTENGLHRELEGLFIAPAVTREFWKTSRKHAFMDATFFDNFSPLKAIGCYVIASMITFDANNQIVLLAAALIRGESSACWLWFIQQCVTYFPGIQLICSDNGKGLNAQIVETYLQQEGIVHTHCSEHAKRNILEKLTKKKTSVVEVGKLITKYFKARTTGYAGRVRDKIATEIERESMSRQQKVMRMLTEKGQRICPFLMDPYINRFGKTSTNAVESTNAKLSGPIRQARTVTEFIKEVIDFIWEGMTTRRHYMGTQYDPAEQQASDPTPEYRKLITNAANAQGLYEVVEIEYDLSTNRWQVEVRMNETDALAWNVTCGGLPGEGDVTVCTCRHLEEMGYPCSHIRAAFKYAKEKYGFPYNFHGRCHNEVTMGRWYEQYQVLHRPCSVYIDPGFKKEDLRLPQWKKSQGRPKDAPRKGKNSRVRQKKCGFCGEKGHNRRRYYPTFHTYTTKSIVRRG